METKHIIIIIAVILIAAVGAFFLLGSPMTTEHTTLLISDSSYMEVPLASSAISNADNDGVFYYVDTANGLNVTSTNPSMSKESGIKSLEKLKNSIIVGSKRYDENGFVIYEKHGVYSAFSSDTKYNNTILVQSTNKDLLIQCLDSIKYHNPADSLKIEDSDSGSVVNATQTTEKKVSKTSTASYTSSSSGSSSSSSSSVSTSSKSFVDDFSSSSSSSRSSSGSSSRSSSGGGSSKSSSFADDF